MSSGHIYIYIYIYIYHIYIYISQLYVMASCECPFVGREPLVEVRDDYGKECGMTKRKAELTHEKSIPRASPAFLENASYSKRQRLSFDTGSASKRPCQECRTRNWHDIEDPINWPARFAIRDVRSEFVRTAWFERPLCVRPLSEAVDPRRTSGDW